MTEAPERIWADPDHWVENKPCRSGYTEYLRSDLHKAEIAAVLDKAAYQARNACLAPPDGGSPTTEEAAVCDEAARRIKEYCTPSDAKAALEAYVSRAVEAERARCAKRAMAFAASCFADDDDVGGGAADAVSAAIMEGGE